MKAFILAALPWVLCGLAMAVLCAGMGRAKGQEKREDDGSPLAIGLALGLMLSPALNSLGLWESHGVGFALGPLWGMALAALIQGGRDSGKS
ncbi:MAG: hypothetical protein ACI4MP_08320 [Candidatus Ventricola sp.]